MEREKIEKILQRKSSTKFNFYQQTVLFLEPNYGCLCENFLPLTSLYYCQACMRIKCRYCVTESIKCHYCPACLQNVASAEAIMNNNKCKKCFICPECGSNLKMVEKEVGKDNFLAYLTCTFCHWNSSSLILEPAITFIEEFHKKEKGNYEQKLKDFEEIVQELKKEELQKLRQKKRKRKSFGPTIFTSSASKNPDHTVKKLEEQLHESEQILSFKGKLLSLEESPLPHPPCPPISCDSFDIRQIPTLQQKFMHITREINNYQQIFPQRQQLVTLRAKNCSSCNKVLVKPNINPLVVEYKRKHSGLLFLPRLKLLSIPKLEKGSTGPILIKIFNPLRSYLYFRITEGTTANSNVELTLPSVADDKFEFLPPCDFDPDVDDKDLFDKHASEDSKEFILKRKANYAIMRLMITPSCSFPLSSFLSFTLNIKFTLPTGEQITNFPIEFKLN